MAPSMGTYRPSKNLNSLVLQIFLKRSIGSPFQEQRIALNKRMSTSLSLFEWNLKNIYAIIWRTLLKKTSNVPTKNTSNRNIVKPFTRISCFSTFNMIDISIPYGCRSFNFRVIKGRMFPHSLCRYIIWLWYHW